MQQDACVRVLLLGAHRAALLQEVSLARPIGAELRVVVPAEHGGGRRRAEAARRALGSATMVRRSEGVQGRSDRVMFSCRLRTQGVISGRGHQDRREEGRG